MVDKPSLALQLEGAFDSVQERSDLIWRCERRFSGKTVSVHYFDASGEIERAQDRKEYVRRLLGEDYFRNAGDLQWNFYFIALVANTENPAYDSLLGIENDRDFARKFVVSLSDLPEFISRSTAKGRPQLPRDLLARWEERLVDAELAAVLLPGPLDTLVRDYMQGNIPFVADPMALSHGHSSEFTDRMHIHRISIQNYRNACLSGDFDLGRVTLVSGQNGSGKTSLLEAIELALCGRYYRHAELHEEREAQVSLHWSDASVEICDFNATSLYQQRHFHWYGSRTRGNQLAFDFMRYNFFDADSAFRLAYLDDAENFKTAFQRLLLGARENEINDRMTKCLDRFNKEEKEHDRRHRELTKEKDRIQAAIDGALQELSSQPLIVSGLSPLLGRMGWTGTDPVLDPSAALEELVQVDHHLKHAISNLDWLRPLNEDAISNEWHSVRSQLETARSRHEVSERLRRSIATHAERLEQLGREKNVYEELVKCMNIGDVRRLLDLDREKSRVSDERARLSNMLAHTRHPRIQAQWSETLDMLRQSLISEKGRIDLRIMDAREQLARTRAQSDTIHRLRVEILEAADQLIESEPTDVCPICNTVHLQSELHQKISDQLRRLSTEMDGQTPPNLSKDVTAYEETVSDIRRALQSIEELIKQSEPWPGQSAILALRRAEFSSFGSELEDRITRLTGDLLAMDGHASRFATAGFDAERVSQFTVQNASFLEGVTFAPDDKTKLEAKIKQLDAVIQQFTRDQANEARELAAATAANASVVLDISELNVQIDALDVARRNLELAKPHLRILKSTDLIELHASVEGIVKQLDAALTDQNTRRKSQEIAGKLQIELQALNESLRTVQTKHARASAAAAALADILEKDSADLAAAELIGAHRGAVLDIFSRLHRPREFSDLNFTDGDLVLTRKNGGSVALHQISTGQRSALALAFFFALNNAAKNAPKVVLFDDPVAYIDDLNMLSFLDYLRDMVLEGQRQLILSTASGKLLTLLQKKLSFLGPETNHIALGRK